MGPGVRRDDPRSFCGVLDGEICLPRLEHRQDLLGVEPQRLLGKGVRRAAKAERGAQLEFADRGAAFFEGAQDTVGGAVTAALRNASTMPSRPASFASSAFLA
jgi:hypothetical protein